MAAASPTDPSEVSGTTRMSFVARSVDVTSIVRAKAFVNLGLKEVFWFGFCFTNFPSHGKVFVSMRDIYIII